MQIVIKYKYLSNNVSSVLCLFLFSDSVYNSIWLIDWLTRTDSFTLIHSSTDQIPCSSFIHSHFLRSQRRKEDDSTVEMLTWIFKVWCQLYSPSNSTQLLCSFQSHVSSGVGHSVIRLELHSPTHLFEWTSPVALWPCPPLIWLAHDANRKSVLMESQLHSADIVVQQQRSKLTISHIITFIHLL